MDYEEAMDLTLQSTLRLNNGVEIPRLGLGVYQASPPEANKAVRLALQGGYRHIDTARSYGNESAVGAAIKDSGLPRKEVFVTTKLWNSDQGYDRALKACRQSLKELDLEYVDLYLLHWPVQGKREDSWRALQELHADGLCRSIGVSNFLPRHLDALLAKAKVVPAVNQVELSPFLVQRELRAYCQKHGIAVEAYSPLTRGEKLKDPTVLEVAGQVQRTAAQVLIRWALQHDLIVLPKSVRAERLKENANVFDFSLSPEQMAKLDALDEDLHTGWNPFDVP